MLIRRSLAIAACLVGLLATGCGPRDRGAPDDGSALATVGAAVVTRDDVMTFLAPGGGEPPVRRAPGSEDRVGGADPLDQALRTAITDELLAQEADRQGVGGVNRAQRIARLLEERDLSDVGEFDEASVRAWYEDHRYLFDHVATADLNVVVLESAGSLDKVIEGLRRGDQDLSTLGSAHSAITAERMTWDHDGPEVPLMVERIVNASRYPGVIGYDREPETGQWWVVEVLDISLEPLPWTPDLSTKVAEAMRWTASEEKISTYASSLEDRWPVVVDEAAVERFERSLRGDES